MKISKYVRNRVSHYMKVDEENVKLTGDLNILMIKRHAKSMLPLKVNVKIENGKATVSPFAQPKKEAARPQQPKAAAAPEAKSGRAKARAQGGGEEGSQAAGRAAKK